MVSVIIPVYNIEKVKKYFMKAIYSVLSQENVELELLLINDGSKDRSKEILEKIAGRDKRIRVVHKENGGVESARRKGLAESKGQYIFHMDQDDLLLKGALYLLVTAMEEENADIVVANSERNFGIRKNKDIPDCMKIKRTLSRDEFMSELYVSFFGINKMPINIWGKLYRKSFLDRIPEPPLTGQINEDLSYNMHIFPYISRVALIPNIIYSYRWGGFTSHADKTLIPTALVGYQYKVKELNKYARQDLLPYVAIELLNYVHSYLFQEVQYDKCSYEDFKKKAKKNISLPEVKEACHLVKEYGKYHNLFTDAMIGKDIEKLYWLEVEENKRQWKKNLVKRMILR